MNKGVIIGLSATAILTTIFIVGYNKGWFDKRQSTTTNNGGKPSPNIISQQQADKILNEVNQFVSSYVSKNGGMDKFSIGVRDNMLKPLYEGGYKIENNKAVKK